MGGASGPAVLSFHGVRVLLPFDDGRLLADWATAVEIHGEMHPRICVCCGEQISEAGREQSRNPNLCPSCSSLWDGMIEEDERLARATELPEAAVLQAAAEAKRVRRPGTPTAP